MSLKLKQMDGLPPGLLDLAAQDLHPALGGPTLIHLRGDREPALFVSVLLHGDEVSGWEAVRNTLRTNTRLNRSVSLFIGNTEAAAQDTRCLDHQLDFNRCWPGTEFSKGPETTLLRDVLETMRSRGLFASVDIHNNSGSNPFYACINHTNRAFVALANLFSPIVVYFTQPKGVQSAAFAAHCPAVVLECGQPGDRLGIERASDFLGNLLTRTALPTNVGDSLAVYRTVARVEVPPEISLGPNTDLQLLPELETLNFTQLQEGTCFGYVKDPSRMPITVHDRKGLEFASDYFELNGKELRLRRALTPAMISTRVEAIRKDCLCYLMEQVPHL